MVFSLLPTSAVYAVENTEYFCEQEEHIHDEMCYLICGKTLDTVEAVASGDEIIYHKHEESCYGAELNCQKAEHTHTAECETPEQTEEPADGVEKEMETALL